MDLEFIKLNVSKFGWVNAVRGVWPLAAHDLAAYYRRQVNGDWWVSIEL